MNIPGWLLLPLLLVALGVVLSGAVLATLAGYKRPVLAQRLGQAGAVMGCLLGLAVAILGLLQTVPAEMVLPWNMPGGTMRLGMDALSAFFLLPVFGLGLLCAIYGRVYLQLHNGHGHPASLWLHFNLLIFGMAAVIIARDGLMFMLAWEVMALAPLFLVNYQDEKESSRHAAWIYFIASHLGAVFLLVMFVTLATLAGSSDFTGFSPALAAHPQWVPVIFILALFGFGSKAGFVPMHIWLPQAHPAAPSHASALMSGAMLKVGIYGLVRVLIMLGPPSAWWGWLLIGIGALSGILGVVFALAQHDLKQLLAYHSVENIGIIVLGLGIGTLGLALDHPVIAVLGFTGGLLHVLNHSIFKGLLFLGAGAVQTRTHTLAIESLGGLLKQMPISGLAFLIGAVAITGLPPFNGFVSEFLIFIAGFNAVAGTAVEMSAGGIVILVALSLISGLAAACFAKAVGVVYLGEPRSAAASSAREVPGGMLGPMLVLAGLCILLGLAAPLIMVIMVVPVVQASGVEIAIVQPALSAIGQVLMNAIVVFVLVAGMASILWHWRNHHLAAVGVRRGPTWGCGFPYITSRMQYSASSFADPLNRQFGILAHIERHTAHPTGLFPHTTPSLATHSTDPFHQLMFEPVFIWFKQMLGRAEIIQRGHTHIYVLYLALSLLLSIVIAINL